MFNQVKLSLLFIFICSNCSEKLLGVFDSSSLNTILLLNLLTFTSPNDPLAEPINDLFTALEDSFS